MGEKIVLAVAEQIKGKQPFEIQEFCFSYIETDFNPTDELDNQIRKEAYKHGLDKQLILEVFAVELRDALLEKEGLELEDPDTG